MKILALETSTTHGSVAVLDDAGVVLFHEAFVADRSHSSALFTALERAQVACGPYDVIAVGLGPGSYAGVRIAITAALGLSLASGARLVGLPSIAGVDVAAPRYLAIGDARRETFYFSLVEDGCCRLGPELITAETLQQRLAEFAAVPVFASESLAAVPQAQLAFPTAQRLARLALLERGIVAEGDLQPLYLREPHITYPKAKSPPGS